MKAARYFTVVLEPLVDQLKYLKMAIFLASGVVQSDCNFPVSAL